jgi:hypothetical protein
MVKNEASGQVLGVQYIRKGEDYREFVFYLTEGIITDTVAFRPSYVCCGWMFLEFQEGVCQETSSSSLEFRRSRPQGCKTPDAESRPRRVGQQCACTIIPNRPTRYPYTRRYPREVALRWNRGTPQVSSLYRSTRPSCLAPETLRCGAQLI